MNIKKCVSICLAVLLISTVNTKVFAEFFSVSGGIPVIHTVNTNDVKFETESVSGLLAHIKFPIMVGVGLENYVTTFKKKDGFKNQTLTTTMFDIFYLAPVPIINFTVGLGGGTFVFECDLDDGSEDTCSDYYETAIGYQWWAQLGFTVFPFLDIHASYHNLAATAESKKSGVDSVDLGGSMFALGAAFIF